MIHRDVSQSQKNKAERDICLLFPPPPTKNPATNYPAIHTGPFGVFHIRTRAKRRADVHHLFFSFSISVRYITAPLHKQLTLIPAPLPQALPSRDQRIHNIRPRLPEPSPRDDIAARVLALRDRRREPRKQLGQAAVVRGIVHKVIEDEAHPRGGRTVKIRL